jgi:NTP pyrophosphatase (non-canonical NTP hydrolase)
LLYAQEYNLGQNPHSQKGMKEINELIRALTEFRDEREWRQFHTPKDLALALSIEASELNEVFLWKNSADADKEKVKEELADVICYALLLANEYDFNIEQIVTEKIKINAKKYPLEKSKGVSTKYDAL